MWSPESPWRIPLAALLLVLPVAGGGCRRQTPVDRGASVILVSIDTLRADRLPAYGYTAVETPALDALARESVLFENALCHVPLTLPSHASIFTGLMPFRHGVRDNVGYRLAESPATLAGYLRERDYATGGAVSAVVLNRGTGIARGFDFWEDGVEGSGTAQALGQVQRSGAQTERLLESWILRQKGGRPVFAFLHLYEPHAPYDPPEPHRTRYRGRGYDGEIAAADEVLGRLVAFLKARDLYDRSLLIVLSDHGEGLGEHGEDEHGILLYRETLRVPLLVRLPRARRGGERVRSPAQLADVFPTIAEVIGEKAPPGLPGASLLSLPDRGAPRRIYAETLYPRYHFGWSDLASLSDDRFHYIHSPRPELYDFRADPGETQDLAPAVPSAFRSLRAALERIDRPLQPPGAADPDTLKKLAALGYIGVAAPVSEGEALPNPRDRIGVIGRLKESTRLLSSRREEEAIAILRDLLRENPRMLDVWEGLARALRQSGRPREAIEALERADRLAPGTPQIILGLADLHLENGDFARARGLALAAGEAGAAGYREELAMIALASGDLPAAEREAWAALGRSETARGPLLLLARIEERRGRFAAALAHLERALELERSWSQPAMKGLQSTRGNVLARLGRGQEAEEAFRAEIEAFPDNLDAWSRLALLYASAGRLLDFRRLLEEQTRRVPTPRSFQAAARVADIVGDGRTASDFRRRSRLDPLPRM